VFAAENGRHASRSKAGRAPAHSFCGDVPRTPSVFPMIGAARHSPKCGTTINRAVTDRRYRIPAPLSIRLGGTSISYRVWCRLSGALHSALTKACSANTELTVPQSGARRYNCILVARITYVRERTLRQTGFVGRLRSGVFHKSFLRHRG